MGNVQLKVVGCISYFVSNEKNVLAIGDLVWACCLSLGRCSEPLHLENIYLARPWFVGYIDGT